MKKNKRKERRVKHVLNSRHLSCREPKKKNRGNQQKDILKKCFGTTAPKKKQRAKKETKVNPIVKLNYLLLQRAKNKGNHQKGPKSQFLFLFLKEKPVSFGYTI